MKKYLSTILLITLLGCRTVPIQVTPERVATIAGLASYTGTKVWLKSHPNDKAYFGVVSATLTSLIDTANYDPAAFAQALQTLPINELKGEQGSLYVSVAVVLWDIAIKEAIAVDQTNMVALTLRSVRDGINRGIREVNAMSWSPIGEESSWYPAGGFNGTEPIVPMVNQERTAIVWIPNRFLK